MQDGYNGFLVPVGDINTLAEKMIYFIKNPLQIAIMGNASRNMCEKFFDVKIVNNDMLTIMKIEVKDNVAL